MCSTGRLHDRRAAPPRAPPAITVESTGGRSDRSPRTSPQGGFSNRGARSGSLGETHRKLQPVAAPTGRRDRRVRLARRRRCAMSHSARRSPTGYPARRSNDSVSGVSAEPSCSFRPEGRHYSVLRITRRLSSTPGRSGEIVSQSRHSARIVLTKRSARTAPLPPKRQRGTSEHRARNRASGQLGI